MQKQPIDLTPTQVSILARCPLHYHFFQQYSTHYRHTQADQDLNALVRETIQYLHTAGGPTRLALADCLVRVAGYPAATEMVEAYYHRLQRDWGRVLAVNEQMSLRISIGQVSLSLHATIDRLDKTRDGGLLAIIFHTESGSPLATDDLRHDLGMTVYHALVAAAYPLKRPIRLQQLWLRANREVTIELSEEEYRLNLSRLREPVQSLARSEVMARPGLHCERCPFKYRGCPVYAHDAPPPSNTPDDFDPADTDGKIHPRQWIFKI
jgi:RecB family exonuclease